MRVDDDAANSERLDWMLELERSPGYGLVQQRIRDEIERLRTSLENPSGPDTTATLRGHIYGLRTALRIPDILREELKEKEKSNVQ